jgi:anti-sigma-K factor RskA
MSDDRFLELAPLAALGALDGDERAGFDAHATSCAACRGERAAHEGVASRLGLALAPVPPSLAVRRRVLEAVRPPAAARPASRFPLWAIGTLGAAAGLLLALGVVTLRLRQDRDEARRRYEVAQQSAEAAHRSADALAAEARDEAATLRRQLDEARAVQHLVAQPNSRVATLAGLKDAPQARGRVVWNPASREAVLIASGLPPAPEGKAYEVWVIEKAPVAAGVFQVDAEGKATFRLPAVDETARVKTFAVTLEPEAGVPSPTGPMVLAGAVS